MEIPNVDHMRSLCHSELRRRGRALGLQGKERTALHGAIKRADVWESGVCPAVQMGRSDNIYLWQEHLLIWKDLQFRFFHVVEGGAKASLEPSESDGLQLKIARKPKWPVLGQPAPSPSRAEAAPPVPPGRPAPFAIKALYSLAWPPCTASTQPWPA